ncbi:MAG: zinc-binding dehydrogenase, partial [Eubacteriales bacterium]|nr:zinc-binding dehydrogenase [Eubacteriales bacterium]
TEINLRTLFTRGIRVIGSTLRSRTPDVKAMILASLVKNIWPKTEKGLVKPTIYKILPVTQAEDAHAILQKGENVGKVVLQVRQD